MTTELAMLAWGCVLAFVHILATAQLRTRQYGTKWNLGARDEDLPPPRPVVGRLARAQDNFFETFPLMIAAVAIVTLGDLADERTALGAQIWLAARVVYLPLYAFGIPYLRSAAWIASILGVAMVLMPALEAWFG